MKTIIITAILFALISTGHSQIIIPKWDKVEYKCTFCGKSIYQPEKQSNISYFHDDNGIDVYDWMERNSINIPDSLIVCSINFSFNTGKICPACQQKYSEQIERLLQSNWDNWQNKILKENSNSRKLYDKERKDKEITKLKKQLNDLQYQIDIKEGRKKAPPDSAMYIWHHKTGASFDTLHLLNFK